MADQEKTAKVTLDLGATPGTYKFLDDLKSGVAKAGAAAADLKRQVSATRPPSGTYGFQGGAGTAGTYGLAAGQDPLSKASLFAGTIRREMEAAANASRNARRVAPAGSPFAADPFAGLGGAHVGKTPAERVGFLRSLWSGTPQTDRGGNPVLDAAGNVVMAGGLRQALAGGLGRFAAPAALAYAGVGATQSIANYAHDPYMTSGQAGRAFFRDVIPFGSRIQSFADSITGRRYGMEAADVQAQKMGLQFGGQQQLASFFAGYNPARAALAERQRQYERGSAITLGPVDRTTAVGEREFREASRLLPVRREIARLEREASVATKERSATESEVIKATNRENDLLRRRQQLAREIARDEGSGPERQQLLTQFRETSEAVGSAANARREAEERLAAGRLKETEARGAARRGRAELLETQAGIAEERAGTAAGTARTLGGMNVFDRDFAVAALKAVQQFGPEAVHPEMLSAAQGIAPQTVAKLTEASGTAYAERVGLAKIAPADYAGRPEELRKQAQEGRDAAERERYAAESEVAAGSVRAGERLGDAVTRAINTTVDEAIRRIDNNKRLERNAP